MRFLAQCPLSELPRTTFPPKILLDGKAYYHKQNHCNDHINCWASYRDCEKSAKWLFGHTLQPCHSTNGHQNYIAGLNSIATSGNGMAVFMEQNAQEQGHKKSREPNCFDRAKPHTLGVPKNVEEYQPKVQCKKTGMPSQVKIFKKTAH